MRGFKMQLKVGEKLRSTACTTEMIVVRAPGSDVDLRCGGHPVVPGADKDTKNDLAADASGGTQTGKRYADDEIGIEILVTKAGQGNLAIGGAPLGLKQAKALPSSD
jgi:hypothetical protein